jgi:hypothetical protein
MLFLPLTSVLWLRKIRLVENGARVPFLSLASFFQQPFITPQSATVRKLR